MSKIRKPPQVQKLLYSVSEAAHALGETDQGVRRLVYDGLIKCVRRSERSDIRIPVSEIDRYIREHSIEYGQTLE